MDRIEVSTELAGLALQEGIPLALGADGGVGTVTGADNGVIG